MSIESIKKRIIAIDYGTKRIGLAKSDPFQMFAQPVGTYDEPSLMQELEKIASSDGIECFLVGYPKNSDDTENRMTTVVDRFVERLQSQYPNIPIEKIDEFGSSRQAGALLRQSGTRKKQRQKKGRLDQAVAAMLLQSYLEHSL
ncbi:MAG: Holliday junction resolvase RuvX [Chlorobiales bacterium]|nr:Holliday junction resolvase RuvX [Chlorobiales bacterium]